LYRTDHHPSPPPTEEGKDIVDEEEIAPLDDSLVMDIYSLT